ncbi:MAG TPA: hypothetical protein PKC58_17705, partial [Ignavibacteria bacterium]|nr:hypothetical protein [Ignavibacteria bacterium]
FGMKESDTSKLDPEMENQWLNYIYEFENSYKDAKRISVYEYIGKPEFRSPEKEKLSQSEMSAELDRIQNIMAEKGIRLDVICKYENEEELIYKFITEELFSMEVDDMRIEGMNQHFIYEEFHPNHKYDLTNVSEDLISNIFNNKWKTEFHGLYISKEVEFAGRKITADDFGKLVYNFQDAFTQRKLHSKYVKEVEFDPEKCIADVTGFITFELDSDIIPGEFKFHFELSDYGCWIMSRIELPLKM